MDTQQEHLISELLKAGAVYEQSYNYPISYGKDAPMQASAPAGSMESQPQKMDPHTRSMRLNDNWSQKINEFVRASSIHINEIKIVKYNPILLAYFKKRFESDLDDRDVMEIMKYM
jgi:hypothetical protein